MTKFKDLESPDEIVKYLKRPFQRTGGKPKSERYIHHYTCYETAMKILKSRALHLSSPTSLNDEHEYKQFDKDAWKEMYMISFVRGQDESVAMWSMYGKRWEEGIKISFRSDKLENILHNLQVRQINTNQEIKVSSCYFTDIGYRNHKIIKVGSVANGKVLGSNNQLPVDFVGFIKDDIWSYENELRLIVKTNLEKCTCQEK